MIKVLKPALFSAGVVVLVFILMSFFPKYGGMFIFLAVFFISDFILWNTAGKWAGRQNPWLQKLLTALYWLPATILLCLVILGFIFPFNSWNVSAKSILLSLLLMTIVAKVIPLVFTLFSRLIALILSVFSKQRVYSLKWLESIGWITGSLIWLVLLSGMLTWVYYFRIFTADVTSPKIPASFDKFRIVQFSDVHLGNWTCRKKLGEAVNTINSLKPDLIVFTGDMFTFSTDESKGFIPVLKELHARYGIIAIMGNHDYGDYVRWETPAAKTENLDNLKKFYSELGWKLLLNQSSVICSGHDSMNVIGVENWGASRRFQRRGNIEKAEKGVNKSLYSILLSHDPSYWDSIISRTHPEIDLTLSGHTHGGQFGIESNSFRWSILSVFTPLWGGRYYKNRAGFTSELYVNRGLGVVGYSGRVGIRPEITLFILHKEKQ
ncbi:MAG: metallophosphoesterase [Bacteroidota bacterium]